MIQISEKKLQEFREALIQANQDYIEYWGSAVWRMPCKTPSDYVNLLQMKRMVNRHRGRPEEENIHGFPSTI